MSDGLSMKKIPVRVRKITTNEGYLVSNREYVGDVFENKEIIKVEIDEN